jgi:hypothetical protein
MEEQENNFKNDWFLFGFMVVWTPYFFTLSKNILHTYTLPITMPIMFLMVYWWEDFTRKSTHSYP